MNILLTGGAGNIGSVTSAWLQDQGHSLRVLDMIEAADLKDDALAQLGDAEYAQADLNDFAAVRAAVEGMDAIVHLGAIPHPIPDRDAELFTVNVAGSFNVFQAAADEGIKRVVAASSINALGNGFGIRPVDIEYFPLDEAHPGCATDVYSFSKQMLEEVAAYFWRRHGISSVCLRFPFVLNRAHFPVERFREFAQRRNEAYERVMALLPAERRAEIDGLMADYLSLRTRRSRGEISFHEVFQSLRSQPAGSLLFGVDDFWAILDVHDAAQAMAQALLADYEGSHPLYVADARNSAGLPTRELAALFYPTVQTWKQPVEGTASLLNTNAAQRLIGFDPPDSFSRQSKT